MLDVIDNASEQNRGTFSSEPHTINSSVTAASQWHAFLSLRFARTSRGVRLVEKAHAGPLYIQKPFYPEGTEVPHVYLLHPPGGLVSGDHLHVSVDVENQCNALLTTPGAGRLYKAREDGTPQRQSLAVNVQANASFEYLPLEAIAFPNTIAQIENSFHLAESAKLIYWDVLSLGLPANKQTFAAGSFNQNTKVYIKDRLVLQERFIINDRNRRLLNEQAGLQNNPVQGLFIAGPFEQKDDSLSELVDELKTIIDSSKLTAGVSCVDRFIMIRTLNDCSEAARNLLEQCWSNVRPALLKRSACAPRIWRT